MDREVDLVPAGLLEGNALPREREGRGVDLRVVLQGPGPLVPDDADVVPGAGCVYDGRHVVLAGVPVLGDHLEHGRVVVDDLDDQGLRQVLVPVDVLGGEDQVQRVKPVHGYGYLRPRCGHPLSREVAIFAQFVAVPEHVVDQHGLDTGRVGGGPSYGVECPGGGGVLVDYGNLRRLDVPERDETGRVRRVPRSVRYRHDDVELASALGNGYLHLDCWPEGTLDRDHIHVADLDEVLHRPSGHPDVVGYGGLHGHPGA